jgi:hypothetical protein
MSKLPKYVQCLNKIVPEKESDRAELIDIYEDGGLDVDEAMLTKNPNAKNKIMFVASNIPIKVNGKKATYDYKTQNLGNWVYCGNFWYVRKISDSYQFSKYMAYDTDEKITIDEWDEEKYGH